MRFNHLQEWLDWQLTLHPTAIELGLERVKRVAAKLGVDSNAFTESNSTVITVAGTNGKGSCVKTLEALLLAAGKTVGSFTSPHIVRYNERIRANGRKISDDQLCQVFSGIESAREDISLTYFEFSTLAALLHFQQSHVEYVLLEVGLGGRLDSTNIIDTDLAIVTSIDIDHVEYLGDNRESIGREKAGIFRSGVPAINADPNPPKSLQEIARNLGTKVYSINQDFSYSESGGQFQWNCLLPETFGVATVTTETPKLPLTSVSAALMALELLNVSVPQDKLIETLEQIALMGRSQSVNVDGIKFVLDVAHNPAAVQSLAKVIESSRASKCYAICAMMSDKDVDAVLQPIANLIGTWLLPDLADNDRALTANELCDKLLLINQSADIHQFSAVADAINFIRQQFTDNPQQIPNNPQQIPDNPEKPVVYLFGSFFTVEAALQYFKIPVE